jgi:hypothetical protein
VTWIRRLRDDVKQGAQDSVGPDPQDSPDALRARILEVIGFVNSHAGALPGEAVVVARRITDMVREVVDGADPERGLDIHAVVSIRGIIEDYLPTTLRSYLALEPDIVDVPRPSGRTPSESLIEQLDALWSSAADLLDASRAHDADALLAQGSFLRTKFTGSDLDL